MTYSDKIHRDAVRLAVEKGLLKIGSGEFEKVQLILSSKHGYEIEDCLDHPDIFKEILCTAYGSRYDEIFKSISDTLSGSSIDAPILNFIKAMR